LKIEIDQNQERPFLRFVVPLEHSGKWHAFGFRSELLRQSHTPYHI